MEHLCIPAMFVALVYQNQIGEVKSYENFRITTCGVGQNCNKISTYSGIFIRKKYPSFKYGLQSLITLKYIIYAVPPMDFLPFLHQYEFSMKYLLKLLKIM